MTGDLEAIERLLRHSIAYGHGKLIVRRFLLARALGLTDLREYEPSFHSAIKELEAGALRSALKDAQSFVERLEARQARTQLTMPPRAPYSRQTCAPDL